jgi:hypothetical protein
MEWNRDRTIHFFDNLFDFLFIIIIYLLLLLFIFIFYLIDATFLTSTIESVGHPEWVGVRKKCLYHDCQVVYAFAYQTFKLGYILDGLRI